MHPQAVGNAVITVILVDVQITQSVYCIKTEYKPRYWV